MVLNLESLKKLVVMNTTNSINKLTAGEDQLPQDSANVTNGSDNSNPKMLLAVFSSFFAPLEKVWRALRS